MKRTYFMKTERTAFSVWTEEDTDLAFLLWGDPEVTKYISASGSFSKEEILKRLDQEIQNQFSYGIQYWPFFENDTEELIGVCGLRPHGQKEYELGFHLRPAYWGKGYASEAARAVIRYAFEELHAEKLFAGHNPVNTASRKVLLKLGFQYTGDEYYEPTGLYHPSYLLSGTDSK